MKKAEGRKKGDNEDEGVQKRPRLGEEKENEDAEVQKQPRLDEEEETSPPKFNWKNKHLSPPTREDDSDGRYVYELGENLTSRYKIQSKIGEGSWGDVLECWDLHGRNSVAIKVSRSTRSSNASKYEIYLLQQLAKCDGSGSRCVQIHCWFEYRKHTCIVFEKLEPSLRDFLEKNSCSPVPLDLVWDFGRQLLEAVAYVHDMKIIHADLKPENILLVSPEFVELPARQRSSSDEVQFRYSPKSSAIKLIDFGCSIFDHHRIQAKHDTQVVGTRSYRAPEIILRLDWGYPCDLWSVGCILAELCTGQRLFKTEKDMEHLAMMERALGQPPEHLTIRATREAEKYFKGGLRLNWPEGASSTDSIRAVNIIRPLEELVSRHVKSSQGSVLIDLLVSLLRYDPSERLTARQALEHWFFSKEFLLKELAPEGNLAITRAKRK